MVRNITGKLERLLAIWATKTAGAQTLPVDWMGDTIGVHGHSYSNEPDWIPTGFINVTSSLLFLLVQILRQETSIHFINSCFLAVGEDILWNTAEFFIPMGFALFSGLVFFLLTLGKICYLRLRKWILLAVVSLRVFCFIVTFFLIFTLFVLYSLHYFLNRDSIEQRYADYFGCLTGTSFTFPSKCTLAGPATNFPLLILRGLALSSVGTLLFLNFISWEMFRHWHTVFYELLGDRTAADGIEVHNYDKCIHLVANVANDD